MNDNLVKVYDFSASAGDLLGLFQDQPCPFLLETRISNDATGRFSFLGFDPFDTFEGKGKNCFEGLKNKFSQYKDFSFQNHFTPLASGIVGYLSYDLGLHWENIPRSAKNNLGVSDCFFGFYDCILTIDHALKKLIVSSSGLPERNLSARRRRAEARLEEITRRLHHFESKIRKDESASSRILKDNEFIFINSIHSNFSKQEYLKTIRTILKHIQRGDVYQVNLSQRFELSPSAQMDPIGLYKRLSDLSSVNFGGYFDCGDFQIISNSPERFIKLENNIVSVRPMKGTRPRGSRESEDRKKRRELLNSPKDKAELLMITDLERNDLGKVCEYGSVRVKQLRTIEKYQTVFQATSTIEGILKKDRGSFDVLRACFPGGSVTGCPKIRAMEMIETLEPVHRGIYTGALGYMSFSGHMDFNILIRTLIKTPKKIYFQTGGGIVADSIPEEEYEETLIKAKALRLALEGSV